MTGDDAEISDETRALAREVRDRAARMPDAAGLADMTADALTCPRSQMSPDEIRRLAAEALTQAQQVAFLLGKLAGLLGDKPGEP